MRAEEIIAKREQAAAESVQAKTHSPPRVERFARPGVERFDRPAARPGVERFDRPAARPGVERFDTGVTRRRKPETAGG